MQYYLKRGNSMDFEEYKKKMRVGEICALLDKHTLIFKFGENDIQELKFDESITAEKADILISSIEKLIGYNLKMTMNR